MDLPLKSNRIFGSKDLSVISSINQSINQLCKYLLNTYSVPGTMVSIGSTVVRKTARSCPCGVYSQVKEIDK